MATITEDNSYASITYLDTYCADRGVTLNAATDEAKSILLIKAMDYLNTKCWKGAKTDFYQPLDFPRVFCGYDYSGHNELCSLDINEVPTDIKNAQCIACVLLDKGEDLEPTLDRAIKKEKVDVLEVEYMDGALASKQFTQLDNILRKYLSGNTLRVVRR